jgi:hypothetical protein
MTRFIFCLILLLAQQQPIGTYTGTLTAQVNQL